MRILILLALSLSWSALAQAQSQSPTPVSTPAPTPGVAPQAGGPSSDGVVTPGDNLVLENIPPIPRQTAEDTARYGDFRSALLFDWHPTRREILIGTRFGDTVQVHAVTMPGGARRQLTFFPDRVASAQYLPNGHEFVLQKDAGGGEWFQLYRYDLASGASTLLTDGHSRNESYLLAHHSTRLVFTSTRRNNKDSDLWTMDAAANGGGAAAARLLLQVDSGGWAPLDWSPDNRRLLVQEFISINESRLWLVDAATGEKKPLLPQDAAAGEGEPVSYASAVFSADGKSVYALTDRGSEFKRLARIDLASLKTTYLTNGIHWDIDEMAASDDGKAIALAANESGYSRLYLLDTASGSVRAMANIPAGVVTGLRFHPDNRDLGFAVSSARSPLDVYSVDIHSGKVDRWTEGETGGLDAASFVEPTLVKWKSFDNLELSAFLYRPDPARFPGKRPVIVEIHGGPESQFRPAYQGRENYLINELGIAVIAPNVRGSAGYGKSFLKLDNGFHRDDTYKDIKTLLDWVSAQPQLDAQRVMIFGGSYGGHMTWAISAFYNDRIRCAMPVVGMSNLVTFLEHTEAYRRDLRRVEYGDERDPAMRAYLESIAPLNHLDAMHKPIFAVVGRNDPRVPWTESRQIIDQLNAQGTPTWFLVANDEGHGYAKKQNRDFMFDAEILFIERYLLDGVAGAAPVSAAPATGAK
jgi:dipeptidyl aminopeptidase/acylaminoacyl peptidase